MRDAVRLQEDAGLDVVTDGEMRRLNFQDSFGASVEGYDANRSTLKVYEQRVEGAAPRQRWDIAQMHARRHGGVASPAGQGAAEARAQRSARGIPLRQQGGEESPPRCR